MDESNRFIYEVILTPDDGGYVVTVPDLPGCATEGDTVTEAVEMAVDALKTYVAALLQDKEDIPEATFGHKAPKGGMAIAVSFETDGDYLFDAVSPTVAADMLGVSRGRVSQMIKAGQLRASKAGSSILVDIETVRHRMQINPKSGRPRLETLHL